MYKFNNPLRIVEIENDMFLLSVPKVGLRFEMNENVAGFLAYLQDKETVDSAAIGEYMKLKQISNAGNYETLVEQMADMGVLIKV